MVKKYDELKTIYYNELQLIKNRESNMKRSNLDNETQKKKEVIMNEYNRKILELKKEA